MHRGATECEDANTTNNELIEPTPALPNDEEESSFDYSSENEEESIYDTYGTNNNLKKICHW